MKIRSTSRTFGGHKKDQPKIFKRLFDDKRLKREVKASIVKFLEGETHHFYPALRQEANPAIIKDESGKWTEQVCWDDTEEVKGLGIHGPGFLTCTRAQDWIHKEFKKNFPKGHTLKLESNTKNGYWGAREGD